MKISESSVKHPITTVMIFIALAVLGFMSLSRLGLELFPDVTYPTALVYAVYPGVGPEEVETSVTRKLENSLSTLSGIKSINSTSAEGISFVVLNFNWGTNMDTIIPEIREKVNLVEGDLPEGIERPTILKYNPEALPVFVFNLSTATKGIDIRRLTETDVVPELEKIEGVATVDIYGGQIRAVTCKLNLDAIAKMEIPLMQILQVFQGENINLPGGSISLEKQYLVLRTIGEFQSVRDIENVLVGYRERVPIFLKDLGTIKLDYLDQEEFVRTEGSNGVQVAIKKQTGHNTVNVNDKIKSTLEKLKTKLPQSVVIRTATDQSLSILDSIGGVVDAAIQGGFLAIFVLLFFLRNIRSTLIISVAIPISIIATFSLMDFGNITLNILSLMGITLGVGMFVDNSIVVLESNFRKQLTGLDPKTSAVKGTAEVAKAIVASTLTTLAVFLPMIFVEGIAGLLFRDLALTISFALFISLAMALTLMPVMCSRFLKVDDKMIIDKNVDPEEISLADVEIHTHNKIVNFFAKKIQKLLKILDHIYEKLINWALKHSIIILVTAVILLALSIGSIALMGMEFLPEADEGKFSITLETRIGSSFELTQNKVIQAEKIIMDTLGDDINSISSAVGQGGGMAMSSGSHLASISVTLVDKQSRDRDIWKIIKDISKRFKKELLDVKTRTQIQGMSSLAATASGSSDALSIDIMGQDLDLSYSFAQKIAKAMESVPGTRDINISHVTGKPEIQFVIKRKEAVSLGLSPYEIAATIRSAYKGITVSRFTQNDNDFDVIISLSDKDRNDVFKITKLFLMNKNGTKIPIENVVDIVTDEGPLTIKRHNRTRIMQVSGSLTGDRPLNQVTDDVLAAVDALGPPPPGVEIESSGSAEEMNDSFGQLFMALLLAVALVYMVMASQFESLLHPFIVMFSIPFAIIGLVGALLITNTPFSLISFIGAILLVGIVVNNAIVLIDYMNLLQREGVPLRQAIIRGGKTRLKPILMTTFTTIFGLLPMAIGFGAGGELRAPIGRAVVGGLLTSTLVTLVLIPTIYWLIESRLSKGHKEKAL